MTPEARRARLATARLYLVTDASSHGPSLEPFLDSVLDAGVDIVQLREKAAEAGEQLRWADIFRRAAERHHVLFVVNDRPDIAVAAGADGVHLGQEDLPVTWARRLVGDDLIVGLSTHSAEQFDSAPAEADYLCAGPVHATPTKPGRPATGLELVRHASGSAERRPWFAIGGIDQGTVGAVVAAGAQRIVVVRAITQAQDPASAVRALRAALPAD